MAPTILRATLVGGPHDGHADLIQSPAPQAVIVHWCDGCAREHLHEADPMDVRTGVYLRDTRPGVQVVEAGSPPEARYVWSELDDTLDRLTRRRQWMPSPDAVTITLTLRDDG